ncbi:MAG: hypothetical protein K2J59_09360, partial [Eubacterium sp.]|nr:hypothetical protein [Eubacterium sp.]
EGPSLIKSDLIKTSPKSIRIKVLLNIKNKHIFLLVILSQHKDKIKQNQNISICFLITERKQAGKKLPAL